MTFTGYHIFAENSDLFWIYDGCLRKLTVGMNIQKYILFVFTAFTFVYCVLYFVSIYKFGLSVCPFVSNKRQNGWTDRAQFFCGTSRDPREGLWMIEILNICLHQNSIVIKFLKILKIREFFCENPRIIFVLFYDVHKENMFTINLEDGREAPSKASI